MVFTSVMDVWLRVCSLLLATLAAGLIAMVARRGIRCEVGCGTLPFDCILCFQTPGLFECLLECPPNNCA
jgi:hypothetical protein